MTKRREIAEVGGDVWTTRLVEGLKLMDYRLWIGVSAFLSGLIVVVISVIQGDTVFAAVLLVALAVYLTMLMWWTNPSRGGLHVSHAAAQERAQEADIIVYWRPGCIFCDRLKLGMRDSRDQITWVNIGRDPQGAAFVADLWNGDETVPTAVTGGGEVIEATPEAIRTRLDLS